METNKKTAKPWYKKLWVIITGVILLLAIIGNIGGKEVTAKSPKSTSTENANGSQNPSKEKQWTEIYNFKGNGMKKSPVFELTGGEARLKYTYKAQNDVGVGLFAVYVVNEGEEIMKTGGIPEVMLQSEKEESESAIQKSPGRYYLDVNATGNWTVIVEEKK